MGLLHREAGLFSSLQMMSSKNSTSDLWAKRTSPVAKALRCARRPSPPTSAAAFVSSLMMRQVKNSSRAGAAGTGGCPHRYEECRGRGPPSYQRAARCRHEACRRSALYMPPSACHRRCCVKTTRRACARRRPRGSAASCCCGSARRAARPWRTRRARAARRLPCGHATGGDARAALGWGCACGTACGCAHVGASPALEVEQIEALRVGELG